MFVCCIFPVFLCARATRLKFQYWAVLRWCVCSRCSQEHLSLLLSVFFTCSHPPRIIRHVEVSCLTVCVFGFVLFVCILWLNVCVCVYVCVSVRSPQSMLHVCVRKNPPPPPPCTCGSLKASNDWNDMNSTSNAPLCKKEGRKACEKGIEGTTTTKPPRFMFLLQAMPVRSLFTSPSTFFRFLESAECQMS